MDTDDLIRARLRERSRDVDVDVAWAELAARRGRHRRRTRLVAAVAGIVLIGGSVAVGLSLRPDDRPAMVDTRPAATAPQDRPATAPDTWRELSQGPLSARSWASAVWTGSEVLIAGGSDAPPCPANAQCTFVDRRLDDGAAYEPATDTWRTIADAPVPLQATHALWTGDVMLILAFEGIEATRIFAYDPERDQWTEGTAPPREAVNLRTSFWTGDVVVFGTGDNQSGERDWTYDPAADRWAPLSRDPLGCAYARYLTGSGDRLVLFAVACLSDPGTALPSPYRVAIQDLRTGEWRRLPDSEFLSGSNVWFAVEGQMVNPNISPLGGILDLDTETWSDVPLSPAIDPAPGTWMLQGVVGPSVADGGQLFTPATGTWHAIPAPPHRSSSAASSAWTGDELIVWGGIDEAHEGHLASGAAYTPPG